LETESELLHVGFFNYKIDRPSSCFRVGGSGR
jgi:hypothetical protein